MDGTTLSIISAIGTTGVTVGGGLWAYIKTLHHNTVKELKETNIKLETRTTACEEDRKELHGRINAQSERITDISKKLGKLEGKLENGKHTIV